MTRDDKVFPSKDLIYILRIRDHRKIFIEGFYYYIVLLLLCINLTDIISNIVFILLYYFYTIIQEVQRGGVTQ